MRGGSRAARLRDEILRLSGRGWSLEDGRTDFEAVMSYPLPPRSILRIAEALLSGSVDLELRRIRITVDDDGEIHRRTLGDLPPRRQRTGRGWEVADTDGPAVRRTLDEQHPQG